MGLQGVLGLGPAAVKRCRLSFFQPGAWDVLGVPGLIGFSPQSAGLGPTGHLQMHLGHCGSCWVVIGHSVCMDLWSL